MHNNSSISITCYSSKSVLPTPAGIYTRRMLIFFPFGKKSLRLMNEAAIEAKQAKDKNITAKHIRKIQNVSFFSPEIGYLSLACVLNFYAKHVLQEFSA